LSKKTT